MRRLLSAAAATMAVALSPLPATAQAAAPSGAPPPTFSVRTSIKTSSMLFRAPDAPELFPERTGAESVWRFRVEPEARVGNAVFAVSYEQRLRYRTGQGGVTAVGILPAQSAAPFRIRQLDWNLAETSSASWRHEIDRASAELHAGRAHLTIGRQAIGWGRGVMFGAVDLFAPFSPLEADREWRRGVDAVRADIKLTNRSSLDLVGAVGTSWDQSAVAARVRGYAGAVDIEVIGGRRARDVFGGVTTSAAVGDAELHGELAAFRVDADALHAAARVVWKAVAGGSYRFPIGSGILAYAEYHYSGFGAARAEDILPLFSTPGFAERYLRGDTQILSRHAVAVTGFYESSPEFSYSGSWLHNPRDHSGIVTPGVTYTVSDQMSLLGTGYLPYGRTPRGLLLRSEFGTASLSALLQIRLYL
ncbi:MAG: hypothetical protein WC815_17185 [Vicinamibacterales bacterium]